MRQTGTMGTGQTTHGTKNKKTRQESSTNHNPKTSKANPPIFQLKRSSITGSKSQVIVFQSIIKEATSEERYKASSKQRSSLRHTENKPVKNNC